MVLTSKIKISTTNFTIIKLQAKENLTHEELEGIAKIIKSRFRGLQLGSMLLSIKTDDSNNIYILLGKELREEQIKNILPLLKPVFLNISTFCNGKEVFNGYEVRGVERDTKTVSFTLTDSAFKRMRYVVKNEKENLISISILITKINANTNITNIPMFSVNKEDIKFNSGNKVLIYFKNEEKAKIFEKALRVGMKLPEIKLIGFWYEKRWIVMLGERVMII